MAENTDIQTLQPVAPNPAPVVSAEEPAAAAVIPQHVVEENKESAAVTLAVVPGNTSSHAVASVEENKSAEVAQESKPAVAEVVPAVVPAINTESPATVVAAAEGAASPAEEVEEPVVITEDVKALKVLFEQHTETKCISYFAKEKKKEANTKLNVLEVKYGNGAGYGGENGYDKGLANMAEKNQKMIEKDAEFATLLKAIKNPGKSPDLNFILAYFLRENSFSEMVESRPVLFKALLETCVNLCEAGGDSKLNLTPPQKVGDILDALRKKKIEADVFIKCCKDASENKKDAEKFQSTMQKVLDSFKSKADEKYAAQEEKEEKSPSKSKSIFKKIGSIFTKKSSTPKSPSKKPLTLEEEQLKEWLYSRKLVFGDVLENNYYKKEAKAEAKLSKEKLLRLKKEISILSNSLPDGIFVRVDETRFDIMQVMIIGPVGTPYENGCFLFDLYLPANFPAACPKMKLLTTGAGVFRFNPNLYTDGKVCLSLLGTWDGPGWDPVNSTILQLLVSIWSMILVDYPFENEPGNEGWASTEDSLNYNAGIRVATTRYAMEWHFSNVDQSSCFKEEAKAHLYLNRDYIVEEQMKNWIALNQTKGNSSYFSYTHLFTATDITLASEDLAKHLKEKPKVTLSE